MGAGEQNGKILILHKLKIIYKSRALPQLSKLLIFHGAIVWTLALKSTKSIFKLNSQLNSLFSS